MADGRLEWLWVPNISPRRALASHRDAGQLVAAKEGRFVALSTL